MQILISFDGKRYVAEVETLDGLEGQLVVLPTYKVVELTCVDGIFTAKPTRLKCEDVIDEAIGAEAA